MKSYYRQILAATAVLLMTAACTKHPAHNERETDEITFQVSAPVTKAMFSEDKYFQKEGNRIKIYDFNPSGKYFDDLIGPDVQGNTYGYAGVWPFENAPHAWTVDEHKFFGWLANDANFEGGMTPESFFGTGFKFDEGTKILTIPAKSMGVSTPQFDFLYSNIESRDMVNNPDYSAVNLEFQHLFTAVSFGAKNKYKSDVVIHEFRIERIPNQSSATIDYSTDSNTPTVTYDEYSGNLTWALDKEITVKAQSSVIDIFNGSSQQNKILLWPLTSDQIYSDEKPETEGEQVDDYRMYIKYTSGTVENAERRINFPKIDLDPGKTYHFDISFAEKIVDLEFVVKEWDYIDHIIDFEEGTISASKKLTWDSATYIPGENNIAFFYPDHRPIKGSFVLGTPKGGTWMASLIGDVDAFEIVPDNGIIDGKEVKFEVRTLIDDPKREYTVKVRFAVRRSDGTVISIDDALIDIDEDGDIEDDQFTIIL